MDMRLKCDQVAMDNPQTARRMYAVVIYIYIQETPAKKDKTEP